ncbi:nuclear pore glycoprotein p62 [Phlebotomus argentipes]|uniref:nuclear pore glycoprotein p62 n=1 Tax=Phlebotomus argentipes TaxID=94469 RepID=UPI0028933340|nr:nuclear pore glycoprotein p62 [Phlebotomus argentipes]
MNNPSGGTGFTFGSPSTPGSITFGTTGGGDAGLKPQSTPLLFSATPATTSSGASLSFGTSATSGIGTASSTASPFAGFTPVITSAATTAAAPAAAGFQLPSAAPAATTGASLSFSMPAATTASFSGFRIPTTATQAGVTVPGQQSTQGAAVNLNTATVTTASSQQSAVGQLNLCQLEECINKWTLELEGQEKVFTNKATEINAWDKILTENAKKIVNLHESVESVTAEQKVLEHELEIIAAQHSELEECIKPLESELAKMVQVDGERAQTYMLAENLDTQLKQMSEDLKEVIEHLNEANKERDPNDPIVQIGKILNAHMSSLQWIESSTTAISSNLEEIPKLLETIKRDNDRSAWMK